MGIRRNLRIRASDFDGNVVGSLVRILLVAALLLAGNQYLQAQPVAGSGARQAAPTLPDIAFAAVDGHELQLDLYLPDDVENPPLVVWVHGGGWRMGSRDRVGAIGLVEHGFAIASVSYRLSPVAAHPAQIHDIKGAIRFLRKHAGEYGVDDSAIAIAGSSAGGHLAALVGVTNGSQSHEGDVGGNLELSSSVAAVVSYYGASDLLTILDQSTPRGLEIRVPALELLLGGRFEERQELAAHASPVFQLDSGDPPLLLLHGDQDPQMPVNQSLELWGAAKEHGLDVQLEIVHGAAHGGPPFFDPARLEMVADFIRHSLHPSRVQGRR